ncbi:MAG: peptidylprolyl isomerase [Desulfuromonadales bacterium]|nr:MAG: peptidylprolyl isomerase [Desulfuromonadales bacterium]
MQGKRFRVWYELVGAFLLMLLLVLSSVHADDTTSAGKIVARVNNVPIYEDALATEAAGSQKHSRAMGMGRNPKAPDDRQRMKALGSLIDAELFRQASHGVVVDDLNDQVARKIKEMRDRHPSEEAFVASLQKKGKTLDTLKLELRESVISEEYLRRNRITGVDVPDAEVEKFYRDNRKNFLVPEQVRVRHILIEVKGDAPDAAEAAGKKARDIRERVIREKDFAAVAKETSSCASAPKGGDLGFLNQGFMPAEFDKVAFSLKVGDVSEPVRTKHGFHIIEVLDKRQEAVQPLPEVKDFIAKYLRRFAEQERLSAHMAELRKKAVIQVLTD